MIRSVSTAAPEVSHLRGHDRVARSRTTAEVEKSVGTIEGDGLREGSTWKEDLLGADLLRRGTMMGFGAMATSVSVCAAGEDLCLQIRSSIWTDGGQKIASVLRLSSCILF